MSGISINSLANIIYLLLLLLFFFIFTLTIINRGIMTITRNELKELYENNSNKFVCKKLGITNPTLVSLLERAGIPLKGKGNKKIKSKIELS